MRYSTQKLKFVESYIFISYLSRCFSFFSKMFLHLPAAFPAQKCGSGGQYSGLQWPVFGAPKSSIQGSEASISGSKASTLSSMASTLAPWAVLWLQRQYLKLRTRILPLELKYWTWSLKYWPWSLKYWSWSLEYWPLEPWILAIGAINTGNQSYIFGPEMLPEDVQTFLKKMKSIGSNRISRWNFL